MEWWVTVIPLVLFCVSKVCHRSSYLLITRITSWWAASNFPLVRPPPWCYLWIQHEGWAGWPVGPKHRSTQNRPPCVPCELRNGWGRPDWECQVVSIVYSYVAVSCQFHQTLQPGPTLRFPTCSKWSVCVCVRVCTCVVSYAWDYFCPISGVSSRGEMALGSKQHTAQHSTAQPVAAVSQPLPVLGASTSRRVKPDDTLKTRCLQLSSSCDNCRLAERWGVEWFVYLLEYRRTKGLWGMEVSVSWRYGHTFGEMRKSMLGW